MLVTPAFAQDATGGADPTSGLLSMVPLLLIFGIMFYFMIFRPQQQRMKAHREMISKVRRGDTVVTSGGLIGKVSKVVAEGDDELQLEIAEGTKVRVSRQMVAEVRAKAEPVKEDS
jgi:preprotein translocase subunit YajC